MPVSLLVSWVWDGDELLLIGEPPVAEAAITQAMLVKLKSAGVRVDAGQRQEGRRWNGRSRTCRRHARASRRLSWRDVLTGLASRRSLDEVLQLEAERAQRYVQPFCVVMADVDHLKTINDSFGDAVGDQVLKAVADALTAAVRLTDVVGRYGGDEFLTMLAQLALEQARIVAERMRDRCLRNAPDVPPRPADHKLRHRSVAPRRHGGEPGRTRQAGAPRGEAGWT